LTRREEPLHDDDDVRVEARDEPALRHVERRVEASNASGYCAARRAAVALGRRDLLLRHGLGHRRHELDLEGRHALLLLPELAAKARARG
jgi:hypothetical protein